MEALTEAVIMVMGDACLCLGANRPRLPHAFFIHLTSRFLHTPYTCFKQSDLLGLRGLGGFHKFSSILLPFPSGWPKEKSLSMSSISPS